LINTDTLVLDQARRHDKRALQLPETITLLPLPSASPELNPVERVWLYLRERYLSHRMLDDSAAVLEAVCRAGNKLLERGPSNKPDGLPISSGVVNSMIECYSQEVLGLKR
jgi:hypothetical protein